MTRLPHANSYLVRPGFIAGEYPGAEQIEQIAARIDCHLAAGIDAFVDLTAPDELPAYLIHLPAAVRHTRLTITDMSVPQTPQQMAAILDTIDRDVADGRTVYLHCWGGIGRTGTVVGCWLVRHGMSGSEALAEVARRYATVQKAAQRPRSPETPEQEQYVLNWREPA